MTTLLDGRGVALVGFMASGKSTVGRRVARALGWPFVDLDEVLASAHGPVPRQIRDDEARFRAAESVALAGLCDGVRRVLATGGGTFVAEANQRALRTCYRTVHLAVPLDVLRERVADGSGRPLFDDRVRERFDARAPIYGGADGVVDADAPPDEVCRRILAWLEAP